MNLGNNNGKMVQSMEWRWRAREHKITIGHRKTWVDQRWLKDDLVLQVVALTLFVSLVSLHNTILQNCVMYHYYYTVCIPSLRNKSFVDSVGSRIHPELSNGIETDLLMYIWGLRCTCKYFLNKIAYSEDKRLCSMVMHKWELITSIPLERKVIDVELVGI